MNVPSYTTERFSFGPGILYLGPAGTTPTIDVGAVASGATLTLGKTVLEVRQGSPAILVKQFIQQEDVTLAVSGLEWNLINLALAMGVGTTSSSATEETLALGGDVTIKNCAVKFVHQTPAGGTVNIYIWSASDTAEKTITFGDDPHNFPLELRGLHTTTDWAGNTLPAGQNLVKLVYEKP